MTRLASYSYRTSVEDCAYCLNKFTDRDSLIVHCSSRKPHKTKLGRGDHRFVLMDRSSSDKPMELDDCDPTIQCADCYADVPVESVQESPVEY